MANSNESFKVPVVIFLFKRVDTTVRIVRQVAKVKPTKLYLLADQGRNKNEIFVTQRCREAVLNAIDWPCEIVQHFASENRGVYENIALGAEWVFERETSAIFLEDDNLPETSFFYYCQELLERYRNNMDVLWICGTNYLGQYDSPSADSYMFTQHLLPCGWASWASKFYAFYDGELTHAEESENLSILKKKYQNHALYEQQLYCLRRELYRKHSGLKFNSWDYQMAFSLRFFDKLGISPSKNQIKNIGVDGLSEHGGNSWRNVMTKRFCGMDSYELNFPLKHPNDAKIDPVYEKKIEKIIVNPIIMRIQRHIKCLILRLLGMEPTLSFSEVKRRLLNIK